jgi:hypothetical protein
MGTLPNLTSGSCMVMHWVAAYLPFTNTCNRCIPDLQICRVCDGNASDAGTGLKNRSANPPRAGKDTDLRPLTGSSIAGFYVRPRSVRNAARLLTRQG